MFEQHGVDVVAHEHAGAVFAGELFVELKSKAAKEIDGTLEVRNWQVQKDCVDHASSLGAKWHSLERLGFAYMRSSVTLQLEIAQNFRKPNIVVP